ncbi:uncharacterized protein LOC123317668 [Coccinella septempunctata]|uniref:uncharacterized protein LOC123317668 n=1 Tax=Coccinella septempunctata TaxID=41139 RepID=UPI001D0928A1|nr:uncharacterized protein LOC123317668 [Coccinella septempunctata]
MELAKHIKPLSSEADWSIWKHKLRDMLDYHEGALDVIDGKLVKPEPLRNDASESNIKKHRQASELFRKANSYAKSMISSSVTDAVYQKIMDKQTAREAWEALKLNFEASSKDQLFKVCTDFFAFSWVIGEDVSTHIAKLRNLWNELNNGLKAKNENILPDLILVCKVLKILPDEFENFKSSWMLLSKNEERTFDELVTQLCMYERNFRKTTDSGSGEALFAKIDKTKKYQGFKKSKANDTCNYCKKKGHWVNTCKRWIADGRPSRTKDSPQSNTLDTNVALCASGEDETGTSVWWIDNGATKHVTNCPDQFVDFHKFRSPCVIRAAGKETLEAIGKGTIEISSFTEDCKLEITLNEVWYVPKISKNLFSVLAAQDRNKNSRFYSTSTKCSLEVNGKVVLCGHREKGGTLYKAAIEPIIPDKIERVNIVEAENSTLQLYHERWGHQDKRHVREILKRELGISVKMFLAHAKTLGHKIQELLSDNGGEFDCETVKEILAENGIVQRLTAPYTPEQNGGSERENRTIVEMARTFKYSNSEVEFPDSIWAELVMSAIYILNRTGKSSEDGFTPFELWFKKKPRIKHLRVIGSSCYLHIPAEKRKKMDKKAEKGYLVGYDGDERYRVYIPSNNKVILSRDVQFQERLKECEELVKLPLEDKIQDQFEEKENNWEVHSEEEDDDDQLENTEEKLTSERNLRDRSSLQKPRHLEDYTMLIEEFANQVTGDPETYEDALHSDDLAEWKKAMDREMSSLKENQTWTLTESFISGKAEKEIQKSNSRRRNPSKESFIVEPNIFPLNTFSSEKKYNDEAVAKRTFEDVMCEDGTYVRRDNGQH